MGGGMEANKNRWVEDWATGRENLEFNFRWTRRNFALIGIFGIAVPVLVYKGIVKEFNLYLKEKLRKRHDSGFWCICKMRMQGGHTGNSGCHKALLGFSNKCG